MFQVVFSYLLSGTNNLCSDQMDNRRSVSALFACMCKTCLDLLLWRFCLLLDSNRLQNKSAFVCCSICPSVCIQHHNLPTREIGSDIRKQEVTSSSSNRNVLRVNKNKESSGGRWVLCPFWPIRMQSADTWSSSEGVSTNKPVKW